MVEEKDGDGQRPFVLHVEDGLVAPVREAAGDACRLLPAPAKAGCGGLAQEVETGLLDAVPAPYLKGAGRIPRGLRRESLRAAGHHPVA